MKSAIFFTLGIVFLCLCSCNEEASQPQPLLLTVEGDGSAKAAIEKMIKENPKIHIPRSKTDTSDPNTEYTLLIVEPDSSKNYSILRVEPDPNAEYSIMIYDPRTQRPPDDIDPNTLDAILKELKKRKDESTNK